MAAMAFVLLLPLLVAAVFTPSLQASRALDDHGLDGEEALLMLGRFHGWMAAHGRSYATEEEKLHRFEAYRSNMEFIEAANRDSRMSYRLGETPFTDLTHDEFMAMYGGSSNPWSEEMMVITTRAGPVHEGTAAVEEEEPPRRRANLTAVPATVDWRLKGVVTPAKFQGTTCGSCWAFTSVAAIESAQAISTGRSPPVLSTQQLVDCAKKSGCSGGWMDNGVNGTRGHGTQQRCALKSQNSKTGFFRHTTRNWVHTDRAMAGGGDCEFDGCGSVGESFSGGGGAALHGGGSMALGGAGRGGASGARGGAGRGGATMARGGAVRGGASFGRGGPVRGGAAVAAAGAVRGGTSVAAAGALHGVARVAAGGAVRGGGSVAAGAVCDGESVAAGGSVAAGAVCDGDGGEQAPLTKMGPCGGSGGSERDMDMRGVNRIVKILVHHANAIDAISFVYERNGLEECSQHWGGRGGVLSEIRLGPGEYLTSVKGHTGTFLFVTVLKALTFVSNLRTFGPFGVEDGMPFELTAAAGGKIIGFHGRSWWLLDALGVYVKMD